MNSDTTLADLLRNADETIQALVKRAFDAGVKRGHEDATRAFHAAIARLNVAPEPLQHPEIAPSGPLAHELQPMVRRVPSGTVRPAILRELGWGEGLRPSQIAAKTNLSENTVRGTLRSMKIEGAVEKRGELWFPARKNEAADADPGRGSSTASIENPAKGREAGPGGGT